MYVLSQPGAYVFVDQHNADHKTRSLEAQDFASSNLAKTAELELETF